MFMSDTPHSSSESKDGQKGHQRQLILYILPYYYMNKFPVSALRALSISSIIGCGVGFFLHRVAIVVVPVGALQIRTNLVMFLGRVDNRHIDINDSHALSCATQPCQRTGERHANL